MKAQKHACFHVFSPFSAQLYPPWIKVQDLDCVSSCNVLVGSSVKCPEITSACCYLSLEIFLDDVISGQVTYLPCQYHYDLMGGKGEH